MDSWVHDNEIQHDVNQSSLNKNKEEQIKLFVLNSTGAVIVSDIILNFLGANSSKNIQ